MKPTSNSKSPECARQFTPAKQAEMAITVLDTTATLVLVLDCDGYPVYLNPSAEKLTGYCLEDLNPYPIWETLSPPPYADIFQQRFAALHTQGFPKNDETYLRIRDGSLKRISWSNTICTNAAGEIDYVIKTGVDITAQHEAQAQLRLTTSALEAAANAVVITDSAGNIEWINIAFTRLTGYTPDEIRGKTTSILNAHQHPQEYFAQIWQTIRAGQVWEGEFINLRKDGSVYIAEQIITPLIDESGAITHFIGIQHDITRRKANEAQLQHYTEELEARNEDLDAFAHTVAHDLKNPLGLVKGYAELLLRDPIAATTEELHHSLEVIVRSSNKMVNIINELLLLASTRKSEVTPHPLDMFKIIHEAISRLQLFIEEKQAVIQFPDVWPIALGYTTWIEEVWVNYLSNALKYGGEHPQVELGYTILDSGSSLLDTENSVLSNQLPATSIKFWVRDSGPGIPPEQQRNLFKPFTQLGQVHTEGHGLGLSIVRRIVEKLGGQVGVESCMGEGSVFSFTLPLSGDNPSA